MRFVLFLLLLLPLPLQAAVDYQLDLRLNPAENRLYGNVEVQFDVAPAGRLEFQLSDRCEILSVMQGNRPVGYTFKQERLDIEFAGEDPLFISYRGIFADAVPQTPVHNEDPGYGVAATILPTGTYLSGAVAWYPRLPTSQVRYLLNIMTPPGIEAITSGRRVSHLQQPSQTLSTWQIDYPLAAMTLAAGEFQIYEDLQGRIPIYAYFYAASQDLAATYLKAARDYLESYEKLFGPYPFHKFAIVENFFPTGYGLPSWTLLGSSVIRLPFIVETSLGHEIAHSWWGTGVKVDYTQGNWAEGLTTYVADYLFEEKKSPDAARDYRLKVLSDYASLVNPANSFPLKRFIARQDKASQAIGYGKGMMIFHMLRQEIGDELFWKSLRLVAQRHMFEKIGWDDFAQVFSETSGHDLSRFFAQWLTASDGPRLSLSNVELVRSGHGWLVKGLLEQEGGPYSLTVPLVLETATTTLTSRIKLAEPALPFSIPVETRPSSLGVDPDVELFRILSAEEIPATVNAIRGSTRLRAFQATTYAPSMEARQMLLGALRKGSLPIEELSTAKLSVLSDNDLLIFGTAQQLPPQGTSIDPATGGLTLEGQSYPLASHSVFIVTRNPFNPDHHAAWFLSGDSRNDAAVARKVPHYGKYSYLLFENADNRIKELSHPLQSPLRVEFP